MFFFFTWGLDLSAAYTTSSWVRWGLVELWGLSKVTALVVLSMWGEVKQQRDVKGLSC